MMRARRRGEEVRICRSSVVFPDPRGPLTRVTGICTGIVIP
jgi:hypothetical protein